MQWSDLIPVATAIIGAIGGFVGAKTKNKVINDVQLWKELRAELTYHRTKVDELKDKVDQLHETNLKQQVLIQALESKVDDLTKINTKLETENRELNVKVNELMNKFITPSTPSN